MTRKNESKANTAENCKMYIILRTIPESIPSTKTTVLNLHTDIPPLRRHLRYCSWLSACSWSCQRQGCCRWCRSVVWWWWCCTCQYCSLLLDVVWTLQCTPYINKHSVQNNPHISGLVNACKISGDKSNLRRSSDTTNICCIAYIFHNTKTQPLSSHNCENKEQLSVPVPYLYLFDK